MRVSCHFRGRLFHSLAMLDCGLGRFVPCGLGAHLRQTMVFLEERMMIATGLEGVSRVRLLLRRSGMEKVALIRSEGNDFSCPYLLEVSGGTIIPSRVGVG